MADDEEIIVNFRGDASGLTTAAGQAVGALQKVGQTGSAAAYLARDAILDLSHVARDLPYAASNINILVGPLGKIQTLFFDLKAQTGSVQGAFQALGTQLMGGGGMLIGFELITVALSTLGSKFLGAAKDVGLYSSILTEATNKVNEDVVKLTVYKTKLDDVNIPASERLKIAKEYNKTAEEGNKIDLKQIDNISEINIQIEKQNTLLLQRALATAGMSKLTDAANKTVENELKLQEQLATRGYKSLADYEKAQKKVNDARMQAFRDNPDAFKAIDEVRKGLDGVVSPADRAAKGFNTSELALTNLIKTVKTGRSDLEKLANSLSGIFSIDGLTTGGGKAEKASYEFFNHFFDFDPNAINLSAKRTYQLFQVAFDFAAKENRNFKGLDAILGAKDQNAALDAARIWWSNFEKGIVQFQIPSININEALKLVPHIANDPSQHYLNEYLEGQKNLFAQSEGVLPFLDPSNIDRGALILKYQLLFKSIGKDLPNLLEYQDENGQRVKAPISQLTNIKQLQEALSKVYKEANSQTDVLGQKISGVLAPAFQSLFSAIIAGQNPLKSFFQAIGQQVEQLLQQLIAAAVEAFVISAITGGGTSFGSAFGKLTGINIGKHASGGVAYGPSLGLIGEYANAGSNPEIIAPLSKLKSLLGSTGGAQGGEFIARGSDLILVQNRTQRMQRRTT